MNMIYIISGIIQKAREPLLPRLRLSRHWRTTCTRCHGSSAAVAKENVVMEGLKQRIRTLGAITVADYMKEVLTSPVGVCMKRLIFFFNVKV